MAGFLVPAALCALCAALALCAYSLYRKERAAMRDGQLADSQLYAAGKGKAGAKTPKKKSRAGDVLHEAGIDETPAAWLAGAAALAFLAFAVVAVLGSNLFAGVVAAAGVLLAKVLRVGVLRRRRQALLGAQLVRMLPQLSAGVRSSLTLERAMRVAAGHAQDPLREELVRVLADAAYGMPLSIAVRDMAQRTGNADVRALAAAMRIQQRFGGPLAPALDMIASHANARLKASRELKTELAGTQLAKWFVAAAMPAIICLMFVSNADFASFYLHEPLGWAVMGFAVAAEACGLAACRRITSCPHVQG